MTKARHSVPVDEWMHRPGARVRGHRAIVRRDEAGWVASCSCGYLSLPFSVDTQPCLLLTLHLQSEVRGGAQVTGDDDGLAGVREPRRPLPPHGHGTATRDSA
jgi:hypothetical protein